MLQAEVSAENGRGWAKRVCGSGQGGVVIGNAAGRREVSGTAREAD